jgi:DNA repair protein SbcD/Mre11
VAKSILAGSELSFIGGIESIDICALGNGLEYFALGHIHRGQKVAQEHWRYCGSPLSIDFDECKYNHHIILAQIPHAHSAAQVQKVEVPCFVPMLSIPERPATWEQVVSAFEQINWQQYGELPGDLYPFVKLKVQWEHELADLRGRVEQLCKQKPMRMIGSPIVEYSAAAQDEDAQQSSDFSIDLTHASTPEMLMKKAWKKSYGVDCPEPIIGLFNEIVAQVKIGEKGS